MRTSIIIYVAMILIFTTNIIAGTDDSYSYGYSIGEEDGYHGEDSLTPQQRNCTDFMAGYSAGYNEGRERYKENTMLYLESQQKEADFQKKYGIGREELLLLITGLLLIVSIVYKIYTIDRNIRKRKEEEKII